MPQYYLPLIKFLRFYISVFIRDFVSTGRVPLHDFLYPKIESYCTLTGGQCFPGCPHFSLQKTCPNLIIKQSAYTIGIIYVLVNINYTNIVQERDFYTAVHTGKLYSELLEDFEPYNFVSGEIETPIRSVIKPLKLEEDKYKHIKNRIKRLNKERKEELASVEKLIKDFEEKKGKIPSNLIQMRNTLEVEIENVSQLSFSDLVGWVNDHLEGKETAELAKEVIEYLIHDFSPINNDDFPYGALRTIKESTIQNLIARTKNLPDDSPLKWTDERYRRFTEETDPYVKFVIANDVMYTWYKFILDPSIKLTPKIIRTKYLLDTLISSILLFGRTTYMIYSSKLFRACYAYRLIKLIKYTAQLINIPLTEFYTEEQFKYQAVLKPNVPAQDYLLAYHRSLEGHNNDAEVGKYLLEGMKDYIKPFKLLRKTLK